MEGDILEVNLPDSHTPAAAGIRFIGCQDGMVVIELYGPEGQPLAYAMIESAKVAKADGQWRMALDMAKACAEPGLASMTPEGCA